MEEIHTMGISDPWEKCCDRALQTAHIPRAYKTSSINRTRNVAACSRKGKALIMQHVIQTPLTAAQILSTSSHRRTCHRSIVARVVLSQRNIFPS